MVYINRATFVRHQTTQTKRPKVKVMGNPINL